MSQALIDLNQPSDQQTRTELTLSRVARAWASLPRGRAFAQALVDFLSSQSSPSTIKSYSYSILQLFEWLVKERGRPLAPDEVSRADAATYDRWLRQRDLPLTRQRLGEDPRRRMDAAIWDIVNQAPGSGIDHIREQLATKPEFVTTEVLNGQLVRVLKADLAWRSQGGLGRHLACLVTDRTLTRVPTLASLRRQGMPIGAMPSPKLFRYDVPRVATPAGSERSSGVVTRLTALSSFWTYLSENGENIPGRTEALLRYNIWSDPLRKARQQAPSHQAAGRADKTPEMEVFIRLVETTFTATHRQQARAAAEAVTFSRVAPISRIPATFADLRDRALLIMLLQPGGPRASELQRMRRGHVRGDPPMLTIVGKGGKKRVVPVPPGALQALWDLTDKLKQLAAHQLKYRGASRAERLLSPDAPLLPIISYWGQNAGLPSSRGLSRAGIAMALRRRAESAGIEPGTAMFKKVHPHGFRHLFAKTAIASGTPINVVQAMMGHASGATTLRYMEERRPEMLVAEAFRGVAEPEEPVAAFVAPFEGDIVRSIPSEVSPATKPKSVAGAIPELPATPAPVKVIRGPLPADRPLVAVGAPPERRGAIRDVDAWQKRLGRLLEPEERSELASCAGLEGETEQRLCEIYAVDWGERGRRSRLDVDPVGASMAEFERMMGGGEPEPGMTSRYESQRLGHTYVGQASGLVWWSGSSGKMKPDMPVASLDQLGSCSPDEQSELCQRLSDLWIRWAAGETTAGTEVQSELRQRGATSACALVGWIDEAIEEAAQVAEALDQVQGRWVPTDAPWSSTKLGGTKDKPSDRRIFREHDVDHLMQWFEDVGWQYRTSRGKVDKGELGSSARAPKVIGDLPKVPDWFGQADPIGTMPRTERLELLDFLAVQTGDFALRDRTPRFSGASRYDLARVIEAMRRYDEQLDNVRDEKARRQAGEATEQSVARSKQVAEQTAIEADGIIRAVSGKPFDLKTTVTERIKKKKTGGKLGHRDKSYMRTLGELFGQEAATDRLLTMVSKKSPGPLVVYRDLLSPDHNAGTIVHRPRYADEFARVTGGHSECVARRLGRELWEMWREGKKGSGAFKRDKELLDLVDSMAAHRVPCPVVQEMELRARLGTRAEPVAIYERWASAQAEKARELPEERTEVEILQEVFSPFEEEFEEARAREARMLGTTAFKENPRSRPLRYNERVARFLPNPLELRCAARTAR